MKQAVKVAFASGEPELNRAFLERFDALAPDLPLYVVSEFAPARGEWIAFHPAEGLAESWRRVRSALRGRTVRFSAVLLVRRPHYWRLKVMAVALAPAGFAGYNEHLEHLMLRPRCLPVIARHLAWRGRHAVRSQVLPGGAARSFWWVLIRPREWARPAAYSAARAAGWAGALLRLLPFRTMEEPVRPSLAQVRSPRVFARLWRKDMQRLNLRAANYDAAGASELRRAWRVALARPRPARDGDLLFDIEPGDIASFPGCAARGRPAVVVATPLLPYPLAHGGAVRMFNLIARAALDFDVVLLSFAEDIKPPAAALLDVCAEVVLVRRTGTHARSGSKLPSLVEEFQSPAFRLALRRSVRKWRAAIVQLEFTHLAQFAPDCAPARTVLVEHDVMVDFYEKLLAVRDDYDTRRELKRWTVFEPRAWAAVDAVVTMSKKDRARAGPRAITIPNGVDLARFRPSQRDPEPGRLLFIGAFRHLGNVLALQFFLREVWPRLASASPVLHVIAGPDREHYAQGLALEQPGIEVEGFVADVRPAYERASVVIAPLTASAGTNIKVLEAMALGRAVVSTPAGVEGLEVAPGGDVVVADTAEQFAAAVLELLRDPARRRQIGMEARRTVERYYGWDAIARRQKELYARLSQPERPDHAGLDFERTG